MKQLKAIALFLLVFLGNLVPLKSNAQSIADCLQQLALDYQKLSGLRNILREMYTGYTKLRGGYQSVITEAQRNFTLHQTFLDGLSVVSPSVRRYPLVADIISDQLTLVNEYSSAWRVLRASRHFFPAERQYMASVYQSLVKESVQNLTALTQVMSDGELRMSDGERIAVIYRIFKRGTVELDFLRDFNNRNYRLASQRATALDGQQILHSLYGK